MQPDWQIAHAMELSEHLGQFFVRSHIFGSNVGGQSHSHWKRISQEVYSVHYLFLQSVNE